MPVIFFQCIDPECAREHWRGALGKIAVLPFFLSADVCANKRTIDHHVPQARPLRTRRQNVLAGRRRTRPLSYRIFVWSSRVLRHGYSWTVIPINVRRGTVQRKLCTTHLVQEPLGWCCTARCSLVVVGHSLDMDRAPGASADRHLCRIEWMARQKKINLLTQNVLS